VKHGYTRTVERDRIKMATRTRQVYAFEFGANPGHLRAARAFVSSLAADAGCDRDHVLDLKIAVSEACTNAIRAHDAIAADGTIRLTVALDVGRLLVEIEDAGGGFEVTPPQAARPADPDISRFARGGLGLGVIRTLFPHAQIERNERGGTTVTLAVTIGGSLANTGGA